MSLEHLWYSFFKVISLHFRQSQQTCKFQDQNVFFNLTSHVFVCMASGSEDSAKNGPRVSVRAERSELRTAQGSASVLGTGTKFFAESGDSLGKHQRGTFFFGVTQIRTSAIRAAPPGRSLARSGSRLVAEQVGGPVVSLGVSGLQEPDVVLRWARSASLNASSFKVLPCPSPCWKSLNAFSAVPEDAFFKVFFLNSSN